MAVNPHTVALNPAALIAARQARSSFTPEVGGMLVIQMPGESMRCPVKTVIDPDTVIVHIDKPPISRVHSFRYDAHVGVRRRIETTGRETWEAQQDADFLAEQRRLQEMMNPPTKAIAPAPKAAEPKKAAPQKKAATKPKAKPKPATKPKRKAAAK